MKRSTQYWQRLVGLLCDTMKYLRHTVIGAAAFALATQSSGAPLGTEFTYHGRLSEGGALPNNVYDFRFTLHADPITSLPVGSPATMFANDVPVTNGLFTTILNFGPAFNGDARWLEIEVRPGESAGEYTPLAPRQLVTAAPVALYAADSGRADMASSIAWSGITGRPSGLDDGDDDTTYFAGVGLTLSPSRVFAIDTTGASPGRALMFDGSGLFWGTPTGPIGWNLGGNFVGPDDFLGTLDNSPLTLKVNGATALRLEPTAETPNIIAGFHLNYASGGVRGATISGGGWSAAGGSGFPSRNSVQADFGTIGGGVDNHAGELPGARFATVSGGMENSAAAGWSTVSGGEFNRSNGRWATVPGGKENSALGQYSFAAGQRATAGHEGSFVWSDSSLEHFASTAPNQFLIRANGGVGINTSSPRRTLHVNGDYYGRGHLWLHAWEGDWSNGNAYIQARDDSEFSSIGMVLRTQEGGATRDVLALRPSGQVGIGNTSPVWPLDVQASQAVGRFVSTNTSFGSVIELRNDSASANYLGAINFNNGTGSTPGQIAYHANHEMTFRVGENDQLRVGADGNVTVRILTITGGADLAEPFHISGDHVPKGSVVVIDDEQPGRLKRSDRAYDRRVAGIVSGANGINPGLTLQQKGAMEGGQNVALTGRVYVLADASNSPIRPGDLLTTSDVPGHAMRVADHIKAQGSIIGKAMSTLEKGRGTVLVLVTLQ
jgi:hypothetical protein